MQHLLDLTEWDPPAGSEPAGGLQALAPQAQIVRALVPGGCLLACHTLSVEVVSSVQEFTHSKGYSLKGNPAERDFGMR